MIGSTGTIRGGESARAGGVATGSESTAPAPSIGGALRRSGVVARGDGSRVDAMYAVTTTPAITATAASASHSVTRLDPWTMPGPGEPIEWSNGAASNPQRH